MYSVDGITANETWCVARALLDKPDAVHLVEGRGGPTREVTHVVCTVQQPRERWTIARTPPINPAFAIAEVIWIITGRDDSAFLNRWNSRLSFFAGTGPKYDGAYGARLRKHFHIDQIGRICDTLAGDPASRQAVLQIWDPNQDLPGLGGRPASPDIPCNICSLLKLRQGRLHWTQIMRSNDLFLGLPYNFIQFTYLQEVIAGCLQANVGEYCHVADSLHIYERDVERFAGTFSGTLLSNTDHLCASLEDSDRYFTELAAASEAMAPPASSGYYETAMAAQVPPPYRNLVLILAAEAARRQRLRAQVEMCLDACTNPALKQAYQLWDASRNSERTQPGAHNVPPVSI